jgi:hypothetical protein
VLLEPATLTLPRQQSHAAFTVTRTVTVANPGSATATVSVAARVPGLQAGVTPAKLTLAPGARRNVTVSVSARSGGRVPAFVSGRVTATGAGRPVNVTLGLPIGPPPPAPLGPLALVSAGGRTTGVRFTAGAVVDRGGVREVQPLGNLRLELVDARGHVARELTPVGGARDLLPGEYAYTLTGAVRSGLAKGAYEFLARARGTAGGADVVRKSPSFTVR